MRQLPYLAVAFLVTVAAVACAPAELTPDQIVAAFIAASQDEARTFHMEWQGTIYTSQQASEFGPAESNATLTATFAFSGPDFEGVMTIDAGGGMAFATSYAQIGGANFTRFEGGGWQRSDNDATTQPTFDPLGGLTAAGVAYEGPETIDGRTLHRLRVADPLAVLQQTLFPANAFTEYGPVDGGASEYVVYVDALGIPVSAQLRVDVRVRLTDPEITAPEVQYRLTSDYSFSQWGEPLTIVAPQLTGPEGMPQVVP